MNNRFKKGTVIERLEGSKPYPALEHELLFKVKGVQQSTKEYLLVSLSDPNLDRVLKASISSIDANYKRVPVRKARDKALMFKLLYKRDMDV